MSHDIIKDICVKLRAKSQTLISCGEHESTRQGFKHLIGIEVNREAVAKLKVNTKGKA